MFESTIEMMDIRAMKLYSPELDFMDTCVASVSF